MYLDQCINSVLSQKLKYTHEVIIVNDGSTDNTKRVLSNMNIKKYTCDRTRQQGVFRR